MIAQVIPGSAAAKADLKTGDIILAINDKQVRNASALRSAIGLVPIGDRVKLDILRDVYSLYVSVFV